MEQNEILAIAIANLNRLTGAKAEFIRPRRGGNDLHSHLFLGWNKPKMLVDMRYELRTIPQNIDLAFNHGGGVIVAGYITPQVKTQLKQNGINYLDAAGNRFIRYHDISFFIEGQKVTELREKKEGKLWTATGLKYIWAILQAPDLVNQNYKVQAETAGVALGRIGDFITALKEEAWLAQGKDGWILERPKELEHKWTEFYPLVLKPKLLIGTFRFARAIPKKFPAEMLWGGETAAAAYTHFFLRPEISTIYTWKDGLTTMKAPHLIPDPIGKVLLYQCFWKQ